MYIALIIMFCGMLLGRLFSSRINENILRRGITCAILLLLFLLGIAIGRNELLFENLPSLGIDALILMLGAIIGSLFCTSFLRHLFRGKRANSPGK